MHLEYIKDKDVEDLSYLVQVRFRPGGFSLLSNPFAAIAAGHLQLSSHQFCYPSQSIYGGH